MEQKCLGEAFIERAREIMTKQDIWKVKTLRLVGKKGTTVQGTFKHDINPEDLDIKKESDPVDELMDNLITLEQGLYHPLKKDFCFDIGITTYSSPKGISEVVYFDIERKRDFIEELGEDFNGYYVDMLFHAYELQSLLKERTDIRWFYKLGSAWNFHSRDFSFKALFRKGEKSFGKRTPVMRIPTLAQLNSMLIPEIFASEVDLQDSFEKWKKENIISEFVRYRFPDAKFLKFFMHCKFKMKWDEICAWCPEPEIHVINEHLILKLERDQTNIYVDGVLFNQCKYLLFNIPEQQVPQYDEINSIDEAIELYDRSQEYKRAENKITPEEEFQGHCSNLQAWAENNYDTRLLHSNLAFPLLKALSEAGDPIAKLKFKDEIAERLESGYTPVLVYLIQQRYLQHFNREELSIVVENIKNPFHKIFFKLYSKLRNRHDNPPIQFTGLGNLPEIHLSFDKENYPRVRIYQDTEFYILTPKGRFKLKHSLKDFHAYLLTENFPKFTIIESFGKRYYYFFENGQIAMEQCVKFAFIAMGNKEGWILHLPTKGTGLFFLNKMLGITIHARSYKLKIEMLVADTINISWLFKLPSFKSLFKRSTKIETKKESELTQRRLDEF